MINTLAASDVAVGIVSLGISMGAIAAIGVMYRWIAGKHEKLTDEVEKEFVRTSMCDQRHETNKLGHEHLAEVSKERYDILTETVSGLRSDMQQGFRDIKTLINSSKKSG
jgi:hypothetical protein